MQENIQYYKESGDYNPLSAAGTLILLLLLALILGYAYSTVTLFNPLIYLNLIACIGVGFVINLVAGFVFDLLKIRSRKLRIFFVISCSLFAWYGQWCATLDYLIVGSVDSLPEYISSLSWILHPELIAENIKVAYDYGYFEMFGTPIKGPVLVLVWLLELGIFVGYPALAVLGHSAKPYSDKAEKWYTVHVLEKQFRLVTGAPAFAEELAENPLEKIAGLSTGRGNAHSQIHIYFIPEENDQYLTVINMKYDGEKNKPKKETVISNLAISKNHAEQILANYSNRVT